MKKRSYDLKGIAIVALCDFAAISFSILISLLAVDRSVHLSLNFLWWYLANIAISYVFLILFRLYYFIFESVGLVDTLKILGACLLIFGTGCS
ncbi:MAG: hypothetical protein K2L72_03235, partial [Clostridia bacterium]|nr:hypothetical protein [Clostridia bacterium]